MYFSILTIFTIIALIWHTYILSLSLSLSLSHPVLPELPNDGFVVEELDVLHVVESLDGGVSLLCLPPVVGFTWVDPLQDAQPPEVPKRELQLLDGGIPGDVTLGLSCLSLKDWKEEREGS